MSESEATNKEVNVISGTFEWVIKKICICDCKEAQKKILSPVFTINMPNKEYKWQISLYPQSDNTPCGDYLSLFLRSLNDFEIKASYTFYFIENENKTLLVKKSQENVFSELHSGYGFHDFIKNSIVKKKNNNFSIICNITMSSEYDTFLKTDDEIKKKSNDHWPQMCFLENLMENDKFSDVSLTVGEQIFPVHKCILANRSPVFSAMFEHDMKENKSNTVIIEDVKPAIVQEVLRFIYVGKVDKIESIAVDLYKAADKYLLDELEDLCVESLHDTISIENAIEYLKLANHYNLHGLKQKVLNFIGKNPKEIVDSLEFKKLGIMKPDLMYEISCTLALQIKNFKNLE